MRPSDRPTSKSVTQTSAAAPDLLTWSLWFVLGLTFVVQAVGIFRRNVNWDEFLFLTSIYRAARAEPIQVLQTAYVHLFAWLPGMPGTELDQILIARSLYVLLWALSLWLLYRLGRRLLDPFGAFAAVVLFAAFSYCLTHAASFRIDGLLLPVLLGHVMLFLEPTPRRLIIGGGLLGVAAMLSIKAALWAPLSGLLLLYWIRERRTTWAVAIASVAAGLLVAGLLLLLHGASVEPGVQTANAASPVTRSVSGLAPTFSYMILEQGLFPRSAVLITAVLANLVTVGLLGLGLVLAAIDLRAEGTRRRAMLLILLALPAMSVAFYANAWPYAYVTLIPTACLLAGYAVSRLSHLRPAILLVLIVGTAAPTIGSVIVLRTDGQEAQREVISRVHERFKAPVPYIDRTGMIPSFPRAAPNLTQYGLSLYNWRSVPVIANYVKDMRPPLLIVNTPVLDVWAEGPRPTLRLLPDDEAMLRATYAPYWGAIYLAGREWRDVASGETVEFEIVIPGEYTLVSDVAATIDGKPHHAGATVALAEGAHTLQAEGDTARIRLLWGRDVQIPTIEPSTQPIFTGL